MNQFRHLNMPPDLAMEFISVFSRMEHALKSTGYAIGSESKVEAAWDKFANEINDKFIQIDKAEVVSAKRFILDYPPRKQVLVKNRVEFRDQEVDSKQREAQQVLRFVRTVRNNLFHGGKYLPNGELEPGRNQLLVEKSLTLLTACLELHPRVMQSYEY